MLLPQKSKELRDFLLSKKNPEKIKSRCFQISNSQIKLVENNIYVYI